MNVTVCRNQADPINIETLVVPLQKLVNDQERYDRHLLMSHLCAYQLAGKLGKGGRLLEVGCGSGYGAYYLSHLASEVTAIDLDSAAITQAQRIFVRPNLRYVQQDGVRLPFAEGQFDCVGTFQVIEHIPQPDLPCFVGELSRVLAPEGVCVVSTLNLEHNQKNDRYEKPGFHEKEFTAPELRSLLKQTFPSVTLYGLYPGWRNRFYRRMKRWGLSRWGFGRNPVRDFFDRRLDTSDYVLRCQCTPAAVDLIAVCRR